MAKGNKRIEDAIRAGKLRKAITAEKRYSLEDALKELIERDCPGGYDLICKYTHTAIKHGYNSREASEIYDSIVKEHKILKDWLDIFYRLENGPGIGKISVYDP